MSRQMNNYFADSPDGRDAGPEELRPLVGAGADEEAPVGAALDGQLPRASVVVRHEVLGGRGEVIESILQNGRKKLNLIRHCMNRKCC